MPGWRKIAPPGQEGCRAHQEFSRSLHNVRGGVVGQDLHRFLALDPPPRLRKVLRLLRNIFLIAQPPLLARRGDGDPLCKAPCATHFSAPCFRNASLLTIPMTIE